MSTVRGTRDWPGGTVVRLDHQSEVLRHNPWNDPSNRPLSVYLPAGYSAAEEPYVALWDLAAFTNAGPGHLNWRSHGESLPERLDRLIARGDMPPVVVVIPDCYTSLGGNQYVNSAAVGQYADYLVDELVPFVSSEINVVDHRDGRALFGKSSGGYGSLFHVMKYSDTWGAAACHSGDVDFNLVYRPAFADACMSLAKYKGDALAFIRAFWKKKRPSGSDFGTLMTLAMAASYDPDVENPQNIRLPFDLRTCKLDEKRWANWLAFDPLNLLEQATDNLKKLHGLYIDVGIYDQYHIQFGSRTLTDRLAELGVDFHYEEFDGSHSGIDWRLDLSLPYLASRLKKAVSAAI
jgi:enterochelin esterase-like enzyme